MSRFIPRLIAGFLFSLACVDVALAADSAPRDNGYRGIWFTLGQMGEHGDKYSGGLGTYTANHRPLAVHSPEAGKTFFVYGGAKEGRRHLLIMASYYDHERDVVPRPVIVHDKQGVDDPHDNASIALDGDGHVWVFVSGRGQKRPGFKYRSLEPYSIDAFERVSEEEMTYPQPWWVPGAGFIHVFTKYTRGREIYWNTSGDGRAWSEARKLAGMGGHYQIAEPQPGGVASVFNYHPDGNVDRRTNIYYVQTLNMGATWTTVDGQPIDTPLEATANPALVRDYENEGRLVYLCDLAFDEARRPVVLYVTSGHHMPGPEGESRHWSVARWDGTAWQFQEFAPAGHNYDTGQLWIAPGKPWRVLAPTGRGPSRWGAGGEVALWECASPGEDWTRQAVLTVDSEFNHNYVRRPVNAHPEFYAFWADGDPDRESPSRLYFTNEDASGVWQLPYDMDGEEAAPVRVFPR